MASSRIMMNAIRELCISPSRISLFIAASLYLLFNHLIFAWKFRGQTLETRAKNQQERITNQPKKVERPWRGPHPHRESSSIFHIVPSWPPNCIVKHSQSVSVYPVLSGFVLSVLLTRLWPRIDCNAHKNHQRHTIGNHRVTWESIAYILLSQFSVVVYSWNLQVNFFDGSAMSFSQRLRRFIVMISFYYLCNFYALINIGLGTRSNAYFMTLIHEAVWIHYLWHFHDHFNRC